MSQYQYNPEKASGFPPSGKVNAYYLEIKKCRAFHLKNVEIIISCSKCNFSQNDKNGQGYLCLSQGKCQGTFFQIFGGNPDLDVTSNITPQRFKCNPKSCNVVPQGS